MKLIVQELRKRLQLSVIQTVSIISYRPIDPYRSPGPGGDLVRLSYRPALVRLPYRPPVRTVHMIQSV